MSIGPSVQVKNRFSRWPSSFPIKTISAIFDLQVTPMLPIKFQVKWPFVQENKQKLDFKDDRDGSHPGFSIGTILAFFFFFFFFFIYKSPRCFLPSFKSNDPGV